MNSAMTNRTVKQTGKIIGVGCLAAGLLLSTAAHADQRYDQARVVSVDPVYEQVRYEVPVQRCYTTDVPVREHRRSATPGVVGALIGGAIGHDPATISGPRFA